MCYLTNGSKTRTVSISTSGIVSTISIAATKSLGRERGVRGG